MDKTQANPLSKHFRQPGIYLKLPSQGRYYPEGALELSATGEIPIYPMTVKDELMLKTPDALINGESVRSIISSCCPSIKEPWAIPSVDLDAIFIAIRLASYGTEMEMTTECPHCNETTESEVNLTQLLDGIRPIDYDTLYNIEDLSIKFRPQTYQEVNMTSMKTFEERQLINNIIESDLPEDQKKARFDESFKKLSDMNINLVVASIESITVDEQEVKDTAQIADFLNNCSRKLYQDIREYTEKLATQNKLPDLQVKCSNEECKKEYQSALEFDQANFFG